MTDHCKTCVHWSKKSDGGWNQILEPTDPDTYEPMVFEFEVRECTNPRLLFCERPLDRDGFAVADGSEYMANLYTAEGFGCVLHATQLVEEPLPSA